MFGLNTQQPAAYPVNCIENKDLDKAILLMKKIKSVGMEFNSFRHIVASQVSCWFFLNERFLELLI